MGIKASDNNAFDTIYRNYVNKVYKTALHYTCNHHTAEEITQTVFMKLYMNLEHVKEEAIGAWLLTAAKNAALNENRKRSKESLKESDTYEESLRTDPSGDECIELLYTEEYRELAHSIFTDLYHTNQRWYEAVTITYLLEKPQKEVAEVMGISLEMLHSMLYRAKKWIKKNYREKYDSLNKQ